MAGIVTKIVDNFDDKWMRVLFHEHDFLHHCLYLSLVQEVHRLLRPFESEHLLIMLPDDPVNMSEAALSDQVILVCLKGVGVIALLGITT